MRKVHIANKIYEYSIGMQHIRIKTPEGKILSPNFSEVTGLNWDNIERGIWKRYFSIKPQQIKDYISKTLNLKEGKI